METETKITEAIENNGLEFQASWNQSRTTEQLLGFIARREAEVFATEA